MRAVDVFEVLDFLFQVCDFRAHVLHQGQENGHAIVLPVRGFLVFGSAALVAHNLNGYKTPKR